MISSLKLLHFTGDDKQNYNLRATVFFCVIYFQIQRKILLI